MQLFIIAVEAIGNVAKEMMEAIRLIVVDFSTPSRVVDRLLFQ